MLFVIKLEAYSIPKNYLQIEIFKYIIMPGKQLNHLI